jgi:protein CpxP
MENKRMRILQWTVGLLVLCNIALIATIWIRSGKDGTQHRESPRDYVIRNLNFSDEQIQKYDVLIKAHRVAMRRLNDEANEYRTALFANLKNGQKADNSTDSLTSLITNTQKEIEVVTYNHFAEVRALCTEAQKTEFDNIISDVIKKMNGRPPHPPHEGHGPPPPHNGPPPPPDGR